MERYHFDTITLSLHNNCSIYPLKKTPWVQHQVVFIVKQGLSHRAGHILKSIIELASLFSMVRVKVIFHMLVRGVSLIVRERKSRL